MNQALRPALCGLLALAAFALPLSAAPLSKQLELDFGRDVASRDLKGLATRSDGRILPGPVFTDLSGPKLADILWGLRPAGRDRFLLGTGPDGRVLAIQFDAKAATYTVEEVAKVTENQVTAVWPLADGAVLAGTSPTAALYVLRDGKPVARVPLPADSIFDFAALPDGSLLAATGNPGKIYRLDVRKLAAAGLTEGKAKDDTDLAGKGVTLFGEIRDRNVRRLLVQADRVVAGSAPKGNVYAFPVAGGAPELLQENRDAEVVDLSADPGGGFHAAIVFSPGENARIGRTPSPLADPAKEEKDSAPTRPAFTGRSSLVWFPPAGLPETVVGKSGQAFYRLARDRGWILISAGEQGDLLAYDPSARRSLTLPGSTAAQLSDFAPLSDGRWLLLRNNAPGLALLSFTPAEARELVTKRLDLGVAGELGLLRLDRLRGLAATDLRVAARVNLGSDEIEGWSAWRDLPLRDGAFSAEGLRGRYVKLRLTLPAGRTDFDIDKGTLHHLPQNRRPQLSDFRIFPNGLGLVPATTPPPSPVATLGQLLFPGQRDGKDDPADKRKNTLMNSQVLPQPGAQIVYWTVTDPDDDNLAATFAIRREGEDNWTDLAVDTREPYVQFETGALPEGLYYTRLIVTEQAPRPAAQRLTYTFETDALLIDRTPPEITAATATRLGSAWRITVAGRDALALLAGAEFVLNNGERGSVEQPDDGILDGRTESFTLEVPVARAAGATSVEILLYDQTGNSATRRLPLKD